MEAFRDKVIYQIYPKSFMDSDGDGVGDLRGIIKKLRSWGFLFCGLRRCFPRLKRTTGMTWRITVP